MARTQLLQELSQMRFEETCGGWQARRLARAVAGGPSGGPDARRRLTTGGNLAGTVAIRRRTASLSEANEAGYASAAAETTMSDATIERNPDILGGTAVFAGTRVPVRILMEHLEAGDRLDEFLDDYPSVSREQAIAVLEMAKVILAGGRDEAAA